MQQDKKANPVVASSESLGSSSVRLNANNNDLNDNNHDGNAPGVNDVNVYGSCVA